MQIKSLRIRNFRSIKDVELTLGDTTVLIGPNNSGKTAILEAIRIALTRRWGQRGTGFTEYDVHLCESRQDPKVGEPVQIEIEIEEAAAGDWDGDIQDTLSDIVQSDPISGRSSIMMRVTCSWDIGEESYIPRWEFLNVERKALAGRGARALNLQEFFEFMPVFYLEAIRDAVDEYSSRSQFWGKLLKTVQIPEALEKRSKRIFDLLNKKLLKADPRLGELSEGISEIGRIACSDGVGVADLRVLPLNTWDLLSKTEVIYQTDALKPWLPILRHGQGIQSLSVLFLFKAFVDLILAEVFRETSTPVLALEEPETHLHPHATRSLWKHINSLKGQKIVTSHSPYFLQYVPFRDLRVVRNGIDGTTVHSIPRSYNIQLPHVDAVDQVVNKSSGLINFDRGLGELIVHGSLTKDYYRELLTAFATHPERQQVEAAIKGLYSASQHYIGDDELSQLETFAKRIRGDIFFANRWLLVEGQSEYRLVHGIAQSLNYNLDEHGVSVIDFQNNGNPDSFAVLARALGYPWLIVVDKDAAGESYLKVLENRGFDRAEIQRRSFKLSSGFLEQELVVVGLQPELKGILKSLGLKNVDAMTDAELIEALKKEKTTYATNLAEACVRDSAICNRMPTAFLDAVRALKGLT